MSSSATSTATHSTLCSPGAWGDPGAWTKEGTGRVYYANNSFPTFTGGLTVRGAAVEWALTKLDTRRLSIGAGPITLDCGSFCFGANDTPSKNTVEISNPIFVTPKKRHARDLRRTSG